MTLRWALGVVCAAAAVLRAGGAAAVACAALDKDHCAAEDGCFFHPYLDECQLRSCAEYNFVEDRYHTCEADPEQLGPCEYDFALAACVTKGAAVPCHLFTDCPPETCRYDAELNVCTEQDGDAPCAVYYSDQCPAERCTYHADVYACMPKGVPVPCSDYVEATDCAGKPGGCVFDAAAYTCWPSGVDVPCRYYLGGSCPPGRCAELDVSEIDAVCHPTAAVPACALFVDAAYCPPDRCAWNDLAKACHPTGIPLDCSRFPAGDCPAANGCRVVAGQCQDVHAPLNCGSFYYGSADCAAGNYCRPDCDSHTCLPCADDASCAAAAPCGGAAASTPAQDCGGLAEPDCEQTTGCYWHAATDDCSAFPQANCGDHESEDSCGGDAYCFWSEDYFECYPCSAADPTSCQTATTAGVPDTGAACASYAPGACPLPRCQITYDRGTDREVCERIACEDIAEKTGCGARPGCAWEATQALCYNATAGVPCVLLPDAAACGAQASCVWDAALGECGGADLGGACGTLSYERCPAGRCVADEELVVCRDKRCDDYYEQAECLAHACNYTNGLCFRDSGLACTAYTAPADCPVERCQWTDQHACVGRSCNSDIHREDLCLFLNCSWDGRECFADASPTTPCTAIPAANCPENRCVLREGPGGGAADLVCDRMCCSDVAGQAACEAHGCVFDTAIEDCKNGTTTAPCAALSGCDCDTTRCDFDYDTRKCTDQTCAALYTEAACTHTHLDCEWAATYYVCKPTGGALPCSVFSYTSGSECLADKDAAGKTACSWDSGLLLCYETGTQPPCYNFDTQAQCTAHDCLWNVAEYACDPKPALLK